MLFNKQIKALEYQIQEPFLLYFSKVTVHIKSLPNYQKYKFV